MTLFDHFLIFLLFVVQPLHGWFGFRRYLAGIRAGDAVDRLKLYAQTGATEWAFFTLLLAGWIFLERPISGIGFVAPGGTGFWVSAVAVALAVMALTLSTKSIQKLDQAGRDQHRQSFGDLGHFMPQSDQDLAGFNRLSVTAGIVEEVVFRGFVLWYLTLVMPIWGAVIVSSVAFGLGHSYQGIGGIIRTGAVGLVFGILFVASGSIWLPIIAHILFDWLQGRQIREIYRDASDTAEAAPA